MTSPAHNPYPTYTPPSSPSHRARSQHTPSTLQRRERSRNTQGPTLVTPQPTEPFTVERLLGDDYTVNLTEKEKMAAVHASFLDDLVTQKMKGGVKFCLKAAALTLPLVFTPVIFAASAGITQALYSTVNGLTKREAKKDMKKLGVDQRAFFKELKQIKKCFEKPPAQRKVFLERKFPNPHQRTILVSNIINGLDTHNPEIESTFSTRQLGETTERDEAIVAAFFAGVFRDSQQREILSKIQTNDLHRHTVTHSDLRNIGISARIQKSSATPC